MPFPTMTNTGSDVVRNNDTVSHGERETTSVDSEQDLCQMKGEHT